MVCHQSCILQYFSFKKQISLNSLSWSPCTSSAAMVLWWSMSWSRGHSALPQRSVMTLRWKWWLVQGPVGHWLGSPPFLNLTQNQDFLVLWWEVFSSSRHADLERLRPVLGGGGASGVKYKILQVVQSIKHEQFPTVLFFILKFKWLCLIYSA